MFTYFCLNSPLEQFEILPLFSFLNLTVTNQFIFIFLIIVFSLVLGVSLLHPSTKTLYIIPNVWQAFFEILYKTILSMVMENISNGKGAKFFPFIYFLFFLISFMNLIGLIPYSFTVTSHFIVTLMLSLVVFVVMNIVCVKRYKLKFFSLFLPAGTSFFLAFLLVPVELISYIFKPISLAVRLFCNMMAGHTLLKVFAGFAWNLINFSGIIFFLHLIPILILIPLYFLELGVALIQAYVFSLLTCIYLNDALNLH